MQAPQQPFNLQPQDSPGAGQPGGLGDYAAGGTYAPVGAHMQGGAAGGPSLNMGTSPANPVMGDTSWTMAGTSTMTGGAMPVSNYAELLEVDSRAGSSQMVSIFVAVLLLAAGGYFAFEFYVNDSNPLASWFGEESFEPAAPEAPTVAEVEEPEPEAPPPIEMIEPQPPAPSPYGSYALLPNPLEGGRQAMTRAWTAAEEEAWRAGLSHRFNYQRYKTVMDVVSMKLGGSEAILWDALEERKLWTRMRAAMGLADMGIVISTTVVEKALGQARPEAVEGYFKRFVRFATPGERYVMRESMKVAAPLARVVVLQALQSWNDPYRDLYFAAATLDPAPEVQRFITAAAMERGIPESALQELARLTEGPATPSASAPAAPTAGTDATAGNTTPVDGPEAMEAVDGWDSYAEDAYYGEEGATSGEVEYYNTEIMQEGPGKAKGKTIESSGQAH